MVARREQSLFKMAVSKHSLVYLHSEQRSHRFATAMTETRAIRAVHDKDCITFYQAFNKEIAEAAVREQKLSASPSYKADGMTWIKPSFCWMMYRCGYSYKEAEQERVLALRIKHNHFRTMLHQACLASKAHKTGETILVQWDPERGPRLEKLEYRSLQMGIPPSSKKEWVDEWIESIEDVTDVARKLREKLDQDPKVEKTELVELGLIPYERPYAVPDDVRKRLEMS